MFIKNVCGKWRDKSKGRKKRTPPEMTFQICLWYSDINVISFHLTGVSLYLPLTLKQVTLSNFFLVLKFLFMTAYVSRSLTHNFPRWSEYLVPNPHSSPTSYKHEWSRPCHLLSLSASHPLTATHVHTCQFSCTHTQHAHIHVPQAPSILPPS